MKQPPHNLTRPATPAAMRTSTVSEMPAVHDLEFGEDEITDVTQNVRDSQMSPDKPRRGALTVLRGPEPGRMFLLDEKVVVGRDKSSDIHLDDKGLSRMHARITRTSQNHYTIEDLSSRNGTYVDGERIQKVELQDASRIILSANVVLRFNLVDEIEERVTKQLFEASTRDALTGLYNRRYLDERLAAEVSFAHRHKDQLGFLLCDLDHFKKVNDDHGHLVGDAVLASVGELLGKLVRAEDVVARYGGEEIAILVRGVGIDGLVVLAERVRRAVSELLIAFDGGSVRVTASVGVASLKECDEHATGDLLIALADERLYRAKTQGRNRVSAE